MKRRAWTLVELLVALTLFAALAGFLLSFFFSGQKRARALDFRLHALQATYLLRARLADDIASSLAAPRGSAAVQEASTLTIRRVQEGPAAGAYGTSLDSNLQVITEDVTYTFDPQDHRVYRNGRALGTERFLDVTFSYFPWVGPGRGEVIELHATVVPDEHLDEAGRSEFPRHEVVSFTFHCPQSTIRHAYPELPPLYR